MAVMGEWVRFDNQLGYLVLPRYATSSLPAVVIIHDLHGLDDQVQDLARRIAVAGYVALAPDLYAAAGERRAALAPERIAAMSFLSRLFPEARPQPTAREAALALLPENDRLPISETVDQLFAFAALDHPERHVDPLRRAVGYLRQTRPETRGQKVACMGEELAILLACSEPELAGAAVFYGMAPLMAQLAAVQCPIIAFYGANDVRAVASVARFAAAVREAGNSFESYTYEGVGRGFFNDTRPKYYDVRASRDAFARLLMFLLRTLAE